MSSLPPPLSQPPPPGWWSRHWKWAVPLIVVTLVGAAAGFVFLLFTLVTGMMKSSEPFKEAMSRASANPQVQTALGTPVEPGFFVTGGISTSGTGGHASLFIPISGPKGAGNLYVEARKSASTWTYSTLEVHIPGQSAKIDLKP